MKIPEKIDEGFIEPMRQKPVLTAIAAFLIIVLITLICSPKKSDYEKTEEALAEVGIDIDTINYIPGVWTLVKSDTLPSRLETMRDMGFTSDQMARRLSNNSSFATSYIINYFVRDGKIKRIESNNY